MFNVQGIVNAHKMVIDRVLSDDIRYKYLIGVIGEEIHDKNVLQVYSILTV